jgi:hypothetical protein
LHVIARAKTTEFALQVRAGVNRTSETSRCTGSLSRTVTDTSCHITFSTVSCRILLENQRKKSILQVITITMDPIQPWFIMCFSSHASQGSLTQHRQRQQARSRSRRGSCRARRSTLPSPPSSPRQPNAILRISFLVQSDTQVLCQVTLRLKSQQTQQQMQKRKREQRVGEGRRGLRGRCRLRRTGRAGHGEGGP